MNTMDIASSIVRKGLLFLFLAASYLPATLAEQSIQLGDYTVHYIAVNSTFLEPEIAEQYQIDRNKRSAFLNISVLKTPSGQNSGEAVTASITGKKSNLLGQVQNVEFIEIREGDAIYYIGQFEFSNAEETRFDILVQPEGKGAEHRIQWSTTLYIN